jgi:hypothetical protein
MIPNFCPSRQPAHETWSRDKLDHECAIALGQAIDSSTLNTYTSVLNSYLTFVQLHNFPVNPTPETLFFFTVYMSHHISPHSVTSYLSGICQQLEPYFPNICQSHRSPLIDRTLKGCLQLKETPTKRKQALTLANLSTISNDLFDSQNYDN